MLLATSWINLEEESNITSIRSRSTCCERQVPRTSIECLQNTPIVNIQEQRGFNIFSSSSERSSPSRQRSMKQEIYEPTKKPWQVSAAFQGTPTKGVAQDKYEPYCGDALNGRICLGSIHTIRKPLLMPLKVWNVVKQQDESNLAKSPVQKYCVPYDRGRHSNSEQRRNNHHLAPLYTDFYSFDDKRAVSDSTQKTPKWRKSELD